MNHVSHIGRWLVLIRRAAMTFAIAIAAVGTAPVVLADHGVCILEEDVDVPDGSPVYVQIYLTPGNSGTFLIDYDQHGTYTTDGSGWIRFTVAGDDVPFGPNPVHFAISATDVCPGGAMTVSLSPPDTALSSPDEPASSWLAAVLAGVAAFVVVLLAWRPRRTLAG